MNTNLIIQGGRDLKRLRTTDVKVTVYFKQHANHQTVSETPSLHNFQTWGLGGRPKQNLAICFSAAGVLFQALFFALCTTISITFHMYKQVHV